MAYSLQWIPDSLYNYSISAVVTNFTEYKKDVRTFSGNIIFDIYYKLYKEGLLAQLEKEFENLDLFEKVLNVSDKRFLLHNCFQALVDDGYQIALKLAKAYKKRCFNLQNSCPDTDRAIKLGFSLGMFLTDAGWFPESGIVIKACLDLCFKKKSLDSLSLVLECHKRLLRVRNNYCDFKQAKAIFEGTELCIEAIRNLKLDINLASVHSEFSFFYFAQSNYKEAYRWAVKAISEINSSLCSRELVNVLRIASKACVANKQFKQAELLIKQAVQTSRDRFGSRNLLVAATLIDFGFYLLHTDSTEHAIKVYQRALDIRTNVLGGRNLLVAIAHEELAYASYIYEYSSGRFQDAREHVEKALDIKESLLPSEHFLLPSAKRVHALILEEIAIDSHDKDMQARLFMEAEELHSGALQITLQCLGELNVQTGKHYGNLGRLYQSMKNFQLSQKMHLKAISIKEKILGPDDYEVAISMGHLASLYNYDMELYSEAEILYLKAINIGLKQFGQGYSGLEYDYRGLLRVYITLGETDKVAKLHSDFHCWKLIRDQTADAANKTSPLNIHLDTISPEKIFSEFSLV